MIRERQISISPTPHNLIVWIFALAVFLIPLAMKIIPIHEAPFFGNLYPASILWDKVFSSTDMFNLVKVYIFYIVLALSLSIFTYLVIRDSIDLQLEYTIFVALALAATILITAYLSSHPEIAFWGSETAMRALSFGWPIY